MTTPAQPPTAAATAAAATADPLVAWFDETLRPQMLAYLQGADGQAAVRQQKRHLATIAAFEHWLTTLAQKSAAWTPETRDVVKALASEVRGLLDSANSGF